MRVGKKKKIAKARHESKRRGSTVAKKAVVKRKAGYLYFEDKKGSIAQAKTTRARKAVCGTILPREYNIYKQDPETSFYLPLGLQTPVPPGKLKIGFDKAKKEISRMVRDIVTLFETSGYIKEVVLTVSFSADGKFMGFGIGGATSITIRIDTTLNNA